MKLTLLMAMLPAVFILHDFEEIIMFKPWLSKNREELKRRFPKFEKFLERQRFFDYSTSAFAVAVMHEFLLIAVVTYLSLYFNAYHWWFAAFSAYFLHLFAHIGQWIIYRKYVPVIITSFLTLPYCFYTFSLFSEAAYMNYNSMVIWALTGVILAILSFPSAFYTAYKFEKFKKKSYTV